MGSSTHRHRSLVGLVCHLKNGWLNLSPRFGTSQCAALRTWLFPALTLVPPRCAIVAGWSFFVCLMTHLLWQGLLLPLCASGTCTLREAVIVSSVLRRVSVPVLHSAAALLRLAEMPYSGTTSFFIRVLLDKKYALPYRVRACNRVHHVGVVGLVLVVLKCLGVLCCGACNPYQYLACAFRTRHPRGRFRTWHLEGASTASCCGNVLKGVLVVGGGRAGGPFCALSMRGAHAAGCVAPGAALLCAAVRSLAASMCRLALLSPFILVSFV